MARVSRVYLSAEEFGLDGEVRPQADVKHYLSRVLRLRRGDRWAALDGVSRSWLCQIESDSLSRKIEDWPAVAPLATAVTVGLALCKGSRFEDALEKLAELGAAAVVPLQTERTERGSPSVAKFERWQQIANSASALANRLVPLTIAAPQTLKEFSESSYPGTLIYCHPSGAKASKAISRGQSRIQLIIGPEGGLSPLELQYLSTKAKAMSLGPLILRVETASVCALSLALMLAEDREVN